jgi:hypothetical protein
MNAIPHQRGRRQAGHETNDDGTWRSDMQASTQALLAAHNEHLDEAMNSVSWERRGLLQRLTRRPR